MWDLGDPGAWTTEGVIMGKISKRMKEAYGLIDAAKSYSLDEAIALAKKSSKVKFDAGIELHANLGIDPKQAEQTVRGTVQLPHGTGKTKRVVVFAEGKDAELAEKAGAFKVGGQELIKQIASTQKFEGDVAVAHPSMMRHLGTIAKILGPKGMMPNPKNDTVTANVEKAVKELSAGKVTFRNDGGGNVHLLIGRASFDDKKLKENIEATLDAIRRAKPSSSKGAYLASLTLSSSMGPGIRFTV